MNIHYYLLCNRVEALVASHLGPEDFGHYMAVGNKKSNRGNVLFLEIKPALKHPYFKLSDIEKRCAVKPDGSPKRSKYISVYRVLEHVELPLLGKLYLTTSDGRVLGIDPQPYDASGQKNGIHLYQELCPLPPLVVSKLEPGAFAKFMTDPANSIGVPRIIFADLLLDMDEAGRLAGYLPYSEPMHIVECVKELQGDPWKSTKTVSRTPQIDAFFRTIRRGFFVGDQTGTIFYPYPELREREVHHARWWRSALAS